MKKFLSMILAVLMVISLSACSNTIEEEKEIINDTPVEKTGEKTAEETPKENDTASSQESMTVSYQASEGGRIEGSQEFTERDLTQTADLADAVYYTVEDGNDITITAAGVYVLSGSAKEVTVVVEAGDEDKVQLVLDGLQITNSDSPCIYVKNADKTFITTTDSENDLSVTGTFGYDGDTHTDAVIFAKDDITLNGLGTLNITSSENGISGKDDVKVTGGTIVIDSADDAIEANDSIRIAGGTLDIVTLEDALHAENDEDNTVGYIYIAGGDIDINAGDDAVHATTVLQIDDGTLNIKAAEGLEATYIQINGGNITINASDDGINAAAKSNYSVPTLEINGGSLTVDMGAGDTDALDSNGYIIINGGTVDITAQFAFDFDYGAELNGGTVTVNGQQVTSLSNSMMGGGMMGGPGAQGTAPGGNFSGGPGFGGRR